MKKVCIVTAARSEYGLLRWLIEEVEKDQRLTLQLVVTGSHLSPEFGMTYLEIEKDGYKIDEKIDLSLTTSTKEEIVKAMGICSIGFSETFSKLNPDIVVVLGDRYELLPICGAALLMDIPIAHISGGDVTVGAIDDQIRNAVTMMATLHFPGVKSSADRIERMTGSDNNIYTVGEPGLDSFNRLELWSRQKLAEDLVLDSSKKWVLMTYHPETRLSLDENLFTINNIIDGFNMAEDIQVIVTGANSDYGGTQINNFLKKMVLINSSKYKFFINLGQIRYLSVMKQIEYLIGNSSSGIVEAPFLSKPVINIGVRQKGRYTSPNIINCSNDLSSISNAIDQIQRMEVISDTYYGDGNSSLRIKNVLVEYLSHCC
ncbi:MAG: UDP-N-acetylglucosamine 2-epimerase (hydrolyzing) [Bacteroidetes bacterium]|nr:UDP-N-acetylglucosamine 2-epimerase (hydrolyzing) [Bacteroidota bacterium]MBU1578972.1 UDP-N-acetylglucosamine 2-epimerase (hydrolyzing) [Bacteroidota bacterium]MBU2464778.1 UDP-N-acetylglucosamine 2-epimerase (hydrolyzing) [Bacteroidota bacterium]